MRKIVWAARSFGAGALLMAGVAQAQATKAQQTLAAAIRARITSRSRPRSRRPAPRASRFPLRYEFEDGKLKLSVFIEKDGAFTEIFLDHMTGKVATVDKITGGDDLKDAKAQSKASAKAKSTLAAALAKALAENAGYTAVEITPVLEGGRPVADITLMKGGQFKSASQPLG